VHAASIGHALLADTLYGGTPAAGMSRQALHAWRLAFTHPVSGRELVFKAGLPQDMREALADWGVGYNAQQDVL
jgi:23S rRNA pseudouridine1911/1915/1917 synthase